MQSRSSTAAAEGECADLVGGSDLSAHTIMLEQTGLNVLGHHDVGWETESNKRQIEMASRSYCDPSPLATNIYSGVDNAIAGDFHTVYV